MNIDLVIYYDLSIKHSDNRRKGKKCFYQDITSGFDLSGSAYSGSIFFSN